MKFIKKEVMQVKEGRLLYIFAVKGNTDYRFAYLIPNIKKGSNEYKYIRLSTKPIVSDTFSPHPNFLLYSEDADFLYNKEKLRLTFS
ncbi:hypothetical protein [Peribacillus frigoritolerans]|uniref:hypothetical protein n=1 Tax=Peribacillus castrilensis TaxID=2897690 RepID=UPI00296F8A6C|nr:hypothetical protein [Peribacillus castrilensis]